MPTRNFPGRKLSKPFVRKHKKISPRAWLLQGMTRHYSEIVSHATNTLTLSQALRIVEEIKKQKHLPVKTKKELVKQLSGRTGFSIKALSQK